MDALFLQLLIPIAALLATALSIPALCRVAISKGFIDQPGGRKIHDTPVPPIGGLIIFPVYIVGTILMGAPIGFMWPLFVGLILLLATGAVDDYRHISPWIKFTIQFVAAGLIVLAGGAQLTDLGNIFGLDILYLGPISIPFSIIAVVLFINAINLMDGLDGLAGGISFVSLLWLLIAFVVAGHAGAVFAVLPVLAVLVGFLFHNMRSPFNQRAKLFLGDAGSMCLGLVLAWFCIHLVNDPLPVMPPIAIAWIIALPIIDTCAQFYRRARLGRHPFSPDRGHFHHHFIDAGVSVGKATPLILLVHFVLGGIGYLGFIAGVPQVVLSVTWIIMILLHMAISEKPARYIAFFKKLSTAPQSPHA